MTWDMDIKVPLDPLDVLVKSETPLSSTSTPAFNVLVGHWVNKDPDSEGAIGYSFAILPSGQPIYIKYGKCQPSWSVAIFDAMPTEDGFAATSEYSIKRETLEGLVAEDGSLMVAECRTYTDGSNQEDEEHLDAFVQVEGTLADMHAYLSRTFYNKEANANTPAHPAMSLLKLIFQCK